MHPTERSRFTSTIAVLAGVVAVGLLTACAGSTRPEPPGVAEIGVAGVDCLSYGSLTAGTVPTGFVPVSVVECRPGPIRFLTPEPLDALDLSAGAVGGGELETPVPSTETGGATAAPRVQLPTSDPTPRPMSVVEVVLTGDLTPLLAALARESDPVPDDIACMAMAQVKPQILLLDADGRVVRPQWPVTACGFLQDGATDTLTGLTEVSSTVRTAQPDE